MSPFNFHLESDIRVPQLWSRCALRLSALTAVGYGLGLGSGWGLSSVTVAVFLVLLWIDCSFDSFQLPTAWAIMELHLATIKQLK